MANLITNASLTVEQLSDLDSIRLDFEASEQADADFTTKRALTFRRFFRYVDAVGKKQLEKYVSETLNWETKDVRDKAGYAICAMAVTGINVYAETNKEARKKLQNRIAPAAQALPAFFHTRAQHENLSDDEYLVWYNEAGKLDKLYRTYKSSLAKPEAKAPVKSVEDQIAAMLENGAAVEVAGVPLKAGVASLFVAQGEGAKARMVRLDVTPEFIASLSGKTPDPLEGASDRLLFFRQMLMTISNLLPNGKSDEPVIPLKAGEKVGDTTPMKASNAVVLVRDGKFSAALSRQDDGVVIEFESDDDKLRFLPDGFIDNVTRGTMTKRLSEGNVAAGYIDKEGKQTIAVADAGTVIFSHREKRLDGQLLVKALDRMNTSWVNRVSSFKYDASVEIDGARRKKLEDKFVAMIAKKRDGLAVTLTFQGEKLSLAYGDAAPLDLGGDALGEPRSVRVKLDDFRRVMAALLDLPLEDEITISLDARGMICVSANTPATMVRAYIQTLQDGHGKAQIRERRLLERVDANTDEPALLAA